MLRGSVSRGGFHHRSEEACQNAKTTVFSHFRSGCFLDILSDRWCSVPCSRGAVLWRGAFLLALRLVFPCSGVGVVLLLGAAFNLKARESCASIYEGARVRENPPGLFF